MHNTPGCHLYFDCPVLLFRCGFSVASNMTTFFRIFNQTLFSSISNQSYDDVLQFLEGRNVAAYGAGGGTWKRYATEPHPIRKKFF